MSESAVPGSAARGAVDLTGLSTRPGPAPAGAPSGGGTDRIHVQAGDETFTEIVNRSVRVPAVLVIVSSRLPESVVYLGDVIQQARALQGRLQVVSVDIDTNPGVLRALQVQSVPMTVGLLQAQVVPMFAGVAPAEQVRAVLEQFLELAVQQGVTGRVDVPSTEVPQEEALPPLHQQAYDAIERGDLEAAATAYRSALAEDPKDLDAQAGLASVGLMQRTEGVDPVAAAAGAAADPDDVPAQGVMADLELASGDVDAAFNRLLDLVRRTSGAERNAAREHLIELFAIVGNQDERVKRGRTALMSALF